MCMRLELNHAKNGFPSPFARSMKSSVAFRNSSSTVSMRFLVSGPVSSQLCRPHLPNRTLPVSQPRPGSEPVHLLVDSTGLKLCGAGEWLVEKHAARTRRSWRKLHIGVDADTGQIIAPELTGKDVDDGSQVGPLLEQIARPVASFTGDGAYDRDDVYREVCQRHPDAAVIVPPRSGAVPSATAETAPTKRDRHLQLIAERGRIGWQRVSGYNWRALVEADIGRYKRVIGDALRSRTKGRQTTEVAIAAASLNRMLDTLLHGSGVWQRGVEGVGGRARF